MFLKHFTKNTIPLLYLNSLQLFLFELSVNNYQFKKNKIIKKLYSVITHVF